MTTHPPTEAPADVLAALRGSASPILAGHVVPDGDCIGSLLVLGTAMQRAGQRPRVVLPAGSVSQRLAFMLELSDVPLVEGYGDGSDLIVALDTAAARRVNIPPGLAAIADAPAVVNIDHHASNDAFGTFNHVVPAASSTCELVCGVLAALGWSLTPAMASLLYAGVHTDTAGFSLPNTSAASLAAAADLVAAGADVERLGERLCRSQALSEFRLLQTVYDNTRVVGDGRIAYSTIDHAELTASGCTPADIDDQVSVPRSLRGTRMAMLLSEGEPGVVRINFRGEVGTEVLSLARRFDGGGHAHAAGARVQGEFGDVVKQVLAAAEEHLRSGMMPAPAAREATGGPG